MHGVTAGNWSHAVFILRDMLRLIPTLAFLLTLVCPPLHADGMDMRDFHLLDTGMSQAEVLQRTGPPDRESVFDGGYHGTTKIIWYYIPRNRNGWITEVIFDSNGEIKDLKRYRP